MNLVCNELLGQRVCLTPDCPVTKKISDDLMKLSTLHRAPYLSEGWRSPRSFQILPTLEPLSREQAPDDSRLPAPGTFHPNQAVAFREILAEHPHLREDSFLERVVWFVHHQALEILCERNQQISANYVSPQTGVPLLRSLLARNATYHPLLPHLNHPDQCTKIAKQLIDAGAKVFLYDKECSRSPQTTLLEIPLCDELRISINFKLVALLIQHGAYVKPALTRLRTIAEDPDEKRAQVAKDAIPRTESLVQQYREERREEPDLTAEEQVEYGDFDRVEFEADSSSCEEEDHCEEVISSEDEERKTPSGSILGKRGRTNN